MDEVAPPSDIIIRILCLNFLIDVLPLRWKHFAIGLVLLFNSKICRSVVDILYGALAFSCGTDDLEFERGVRCVGSDDELDDITLFPGAADVLLPCTAFII